MGRSLYSSEKRSGKMSKKFASLIIIALLIVQIVAMIYLMFKP